MKHILFITHSCFPVNGAEEIVNVRLLSALSKSGQFIIDVVTKKKRSSDYPSEDLEEYEVNLNSLHMIEVDNKVTPTTIWQHIKTFLRFGIVHKGDHWAVEALPTAIKLVKENQYDYVLTRAAPAHYIGNYLKKHYGIKWVCTWNDPHPQVMYPYPYGKGNGEVMIKHNAKEIKMMRNADAFIYPNQRLARYMNTFLRVDNKDISIIPHVIVGEPSEPKYYNGGKINFIHSGKCISPRRASNLLVALRELLSEQVISQNEIAFSFMGRLNEEDEEMIKTTELKDVVSILEPVPYLKSLQILKNYDVAVIIEAPCEEGIFLPTKVSDFMMEGKRILTLSPKNGLLHDLYEDGYISYFADIDDISSIKDTLVKVIEDSNKTKLNDYKVNIPQSYKQEYVVQQYLSF